MDITINTRVAPVAVARRATLTTTNIDNQTNPDVRAATAVLPAYRVSLSSEGVDRSRSRFEAGLENDLRSFERRLTQEKRSKEQELDAELRQFEQQQAAERNRFENSQRIERMRHAQQNMG
jgi:hypothetical protein